MLGISHLLISGTAASLLLQTADPVLISVGAIGGLLPDVDVSTSPAGKVFPWISGYFQETMPHRSMTHSIVASAVVAIASYGTAIFIPQFIPIASALTIGYTFGWFADCFTLLAVVWKCFGLHLFAVFVLVINRTNTNVFVSGDLSVEDFDTSVLPRDPYQFKFIEASPSSIKLEAAPLKVVMKFLGDEFASGSLQVRSIVSSQ